MPKIQCHYCTVKNILYSSSASYHGCQEFKNATSVSYLEDRILLHSTLSPTFCILFTPSSMMIHELSRV